MFGVRRKRLNEASELGEHENGSFGVETTDSTGKFEIAQKIIVVKRRKSKISLNKKS